MSIETDLAKEGIKVVKPLDTLMVNTIAKNVSEKLVSTFTEQNLDYEKLFIVFSRIPMYFVEMPEGTLCAKYYYKNSSVYFSNKINKNELTKFAVHELIHFLQENKDEKNNLIKLGLCDFTHPRLIGMALNEAAVQLMATKALCMPQDKVKYFGIELTTTSPDYYPLECCLVNQISYIVGEDILFNSTLNANYIFENTLSSLTSKKSFKQIRNNLDNIMDLEDKISSIVHILQNNDLGKKKEKTELKLERIKTKVRNLFFETQNLILTSYFDLYFNEIYSAKGVENFRNKLYGYGGYIGMAEDYSFFNDYYIKKMAQLEEKRIELEGTSISLVPIKANRRILLFSKIGKLLHFEKNYITLKQ